MKKLYDSRLVGSAALALIVGCAALAACDQGSEKSRNASSGAGASASPAHTPPDQTSEEAETPQIALAREEGRAYRKSLDYMVGKVAVGGGAVQRSGDYLVGYAEEKAEGLYVLQGGRLQWVEPKAENAHLEVSVSDAADGRFVPYLKVTARLEGADGRALGPFEIPFVWHPGLYHYGRNITVPGEGPYTVRVRIEPPQFPRHDKTNGQRYAGPVEVVFKNARFKTGHG